MIRKQVYLTSEQNQFLKKQYIDTGITEAEQIRKALDKHIEKVERAKRKKCK